MKKIDLVPSLEGNPFVLRLFRVFIPFLQSSCERISATCWTGAELSWACSAAKPPTPLREHKNANRPYCRLQRSQGLVKNLT